MDTIRPECAVTIKYTMTSLLPDGTVKQRPEQIIEFIFGVERQVPSLERVLNNASAGDRISLRIPASEIYGDHDPSLIREIPKKGLKKQRLKEGQFYRQMKDGCLVSFKTLEVRPETVVADFNKPMAGISVLMDTEVVSIREADKKEIEAARETESKKRIGCG